MSELPLPPEIANEIDYMYLEHAIKNNGTVVNKETADAVNESIDRVVSDIDSFVEWSNCQEVVELVDLIDDRLG